MLNRLVGWAAAVGLITSLAAADVNLQYSTTELTIDVPTEIEMSLVANSGLDTTLGAIIIDFGPGSDLAELNPTGFEFDELFAGDLWTWEVTLPNVVQTVWGGALAGGPAFQDGQKVPFGTLTVEPTALGQWTLDANLGANNSSDFADLMIKSGDPTTFTVVPEPASLALLVLGASVVIRRTRR